MTRGSPRSCSLAQVTCAASRSRAIPRRRTTRSGSSPAWKSVCPSTTRRLTVVAERLKKGKHFDRVDVLKRYASIEDPSQIMLVIVVDEGPVKIVMTGDPDHPTRVVRKTFPDLLVLPILRREDGYGFTGGARITIPDKLGKRAASPSR